MLKKIISLAIGITLLGSLLVGCGTSTPTSTSTTPAVAATAAPAESTEATPEAPTIKGEIALLSNMTNWANDFLPAMAKAFNAKFPEIKLSIDTIGSTYDETLKIKMSSNDLPDVFSSFVNNPMPKQRTELLLPLEDLKSYGDIEPAMTEFFKGDDGKVYGIPYGKSINGVVIYNKKIFKDLGLAIPTTLDELIAAGKKIVAAPGNIAGLAMCAKDQWTMCQFDDDMPRYLSGDPAVFNKLDVNSDAPFTIDGPWGKDFKLLAQLRDSGIVNKSPASYGWETMKTDFKAGKIGMFFMSGWFVNQAVTDDISAAGKAGDSVGIFPMPFDNSGKLYAAYGPLPAWSIAKNSKNIDAAKALVEYLISDYSDILCMKQGAFSTNKNVTIKYTWADSLQAEQMVEAPKAADITNIWQAGNVDFSGKASGVMAGGTPEKAIEEMNKSWAKGRAAK